MMLAEIAACCKELRLSHNIVEMAEKTGSEAEQAFLVKILRSELEHRDITRKNRILKHAQFYCMKDFDAFRFDEVTLPGSITIDYLRDGKFLETKTNIVMYGNVGTGKTHLSIALGINACKKGIETRFYRTAALVNKLSEAKKAGTLSKFMKQIMKADLLICDEWGYVPLDRVGAQLLFEIISEYYERKTLIINTNIEFSRWVNVFYDEQMTGAIVDRVLHHCHLILFPGQSNRMKESELTK